MVAPLIIGAGVISTAFATYGGLIGTNLFLSSCRSAAEAEFNIRFPEITDPQIRKNLLDAFTHTYTSARITQTTGEDIAKLLGDLNELRGGNTDADKNMDYWNNRLGRDLGGQISSESDLLNAIESAIRNNETINDPISDTRQYSDTYSKLSPEAIEELKQLQDLESFDDDSFDNFSNCLDQLCDQMNDSDGDGREDPPPNYPPGEEPNPPGRPDLPTPPNREEDQGSPLVLDLDGDGVELYALGDYGTFFDLRGNGQAVLTGWVEPDDGLLALDVNGDGAINDITELFGSVDVDGFSELAVYDTNKDGVIDNNDAVFSNLLIWTDINSDGKSQEGELHTLADYNIASISLDALRLAKVDIAGNDITHKATYTLTDGTERELVDAWFSYDTGYTHNVADYDLDIRALFMPTLRGFGDLKDLHIALSLDNGEDAESLMSQMEALVSTIDLSGAFADLTALDEAIENILLRWAGVEDIDPTSRGEFVDARYLAFNEAIRGDDFVQYGQSDPLPEAGEYSEAVFEYIKTYYTAQILTQLAGNEVFADVSYNLYTAGLQGDFTLLQSGIDAIQVVAADVNTDAAEVWTHFAQYIGYTKGLDNLTTEEITALDAAVLATGEASLSYWQDVVNVMTISLGSIIESSDDWGSFEIYYDNYTEGTVGDDTIIDDNAGGFTDNEFDGKAGNDIIQGLDGHDKLMGGAGNDTLEGGEGDDYLLGGLDDDIYLYETGNDTVSEVDGGGYDEIRILASTGLTQVNMTDIYRYGDDLIIALDTGDFITVDNYSETDAGIERLVFEADGTEIDFTALINQKYNGSEGTDKLDVAGENYQILEVYGNGGNDTIEAYGAAAQFYGGEGYDVLIGDYLDDELFGESGDDYLLGSDGNDYLDGGDGKDVLDGGAGDDTLNGGDGANIFVFNKDDGKDFIEEQSTSNGSKIVFSDDILASDITIKRTTSAVNDITLEIVDSNNCVTIEHFNSYNGGWLYLIDDYEFSDGTTWDAAYIREKYLSDNTTSGDDTVIGFSIGDTFLSSAGNDYFMGYGGNDTYTWGAGAGNDTIYENGSNADDLLILEDLNQSDVSMKRILDDLVITNLATSEALTIEDQFGFSYLHVDTFEFADGTTITDDDIKDLIGSDINGTSVNDIIFGESTNDTINSYEGNDTIYGGAGDDTLIGGAGNDTLRGEGGNDNYIWSVGDGNDIIYENYSDTDQLVLHDVDIEDLCIMKNGTVDLDIYIGDEVITIDNQLRSDYYDDTSNDKYQVERILLDDGTTIDLTSNLTFEGTSGNDTLTGLYLGDDTLIGGDGDDALYSYDGDDTLIGGTGNDTLYGGSGDDTYVFDIGDGVNTITETSGFDQIELGENISLDDLTFTQVGDDLEIQIASGFIITDFYSGDAGKLVEQIQFADGTIFNLTSLLNTAPVAVDDAVSTDEDTSITINILENDSDDDGDTLTISSIDAPANGIITVNADNTITYMPDANFNGNESITYTISDGNGGEDIATIDITVNSVNDDPVISNNGVSIDEDTSVTLTAAMLEATDEDNSLSELVFSLNTVTAEGVLQLNGSDLLEGDSFVMQDIQDGLVSFTPNSNQNGVDQFNFTLSDGSYTIADQTFVITVNAINDAPVAINDTFSVDYEQSISGNVLDDNGDGADSDAENDTLQVVETSVTSSQGAVVTLSSNGDFTYDAPIGYSGEDSFTYTVSDGNGGENTATVTITIGNNPDAIYGTSANNYLYGTAANDIIYGLEGVDTLYGDLGDDVIYGGDGNDKLYGEEGNDTLYGDDGADYLYGGIGDDVLYAGAGDDLIYGQDGSDTLVYDVSSDGYIIFCDYSTYFKIVAPDGDVDKVYNDVETIQFADVTLDVESLGLVLNGEGWGTSTITGTSANNYLYGTVANDIIYGLEGVDTLHGDLGDDVIYGGDGNDKLYGEEGNDTLYGGEGSDYLYGGDGDDTINGGTGVDMLYGQDGADTFVFDTESGVLDSDNIQDFDLTEGDKLDISDLLSGYDPLSDAIADFVQITESNGNSYLAVDTDGGADNFVQIAYLYGATGLTDEAALEASGNLITV